MIKQIAWGIILFANFLTVTPVHAELSPEAQAAMKKGFLAAKEQEWEVAIKNFQEALKTAPNAPEVFYNLALAESKIPGREQRAIVCFGAYLAANPNAPNAAAVNEFISGLEIKSEGNISRLLKTLQAAANQIPTRYEVSMSGEKMEVQKEGALARVAKLYALSGDGNKAADIAIESKIDLNRMVDSGVIGTMIWDGGEGGISGAKRLLSMAADGYWKELNGTYIYGEIAEQEAKSGDIAGAWRDLNSMPHKNNGATIQHKVKVLIAIAKTQFIAGNKESSWKTLLQAKDVIDTRDASGASFDDEAKALAEAQIKSGDSTNAQITASLIQRKDLKSSALAARSQYTTESQPIGVNDWYMCLAGYGPGCAVDAPVFLDPGTYFKSLPSEDPTKYFDALKETAEKVIGVQNTIDRMLKQQAKQ